MTIILVLTFLARFLVIKRGEQLRLSHVGCYLVVTPNSFVYTLQEHIWQAEGGFID